MTTLVMSAPQVAHAVSRARRELGHPVHPKPLVNPGGDGLYRVSWDNGDAAEITIVRRKPCVIHDRLD
jgi:hypothetical protein